MKNKLLIIVIILFSVYYCGQTKSENFETEIKKSLTTLVENIKEKKINSAVEYIYPRYFEVVSKEQLTQLLNLTYNNPSFLTEIQNFNIEDIEKPEKIKNEYYSLINYSFRMKFKIDWSVMLNSEQVRSLLSDGIIKKYGKENVKYFSNEDYYIINAKMKCCAISDNRGKWTFLIIEPKYKPQLKSILPEEVLNKF